MPQTPPNILLLISDNQRLDTLGIMNQTACRTPTWDHMAREGVLFDHLRTTNPVCSPARASLFTGLRPHQAGMPTIGFDYAENDDGTGGDRAPRLNVPPFSLHLRDAGYETIYAGKWHLGEHNIGQWFDATAATDQAFRDYTQFCHVHGLSDGYVFHDENRSKPFRSKHYPHMSIPRTGVFHLPDDKEQNFWILSRAAELLAVRRADRPLFMTLSFEGPHPPMVVPRRFHDMYDPSAIPQPDNWGPTAAEPSFLADSYYRRQWREMGEDFDAWRKSFAVYWGYATYIDELFGRFLDLCAEAGVLENTLVVMLSDHGEMLGQHGLNQKMCPYEENLRVPCVMRLPGVIAPESRCTTDVSMIDLAPTILAAAGVETGPLNMEGENLLPYLTGQTPPPDRRDCFSQCDLTPFEQTWHGVENWRLIVRRPWKYVLHQNGETELYQIENDPKETRNLAGTPQSDGIQAELHEALLQTAQRTGDQFLEKLNAPSA